MKLITEAELRTRWGRDPDVVVEVPEDAIITPVARDFIKEHGIRLIFLQKERESTALPVSSASKAGCAGFRDALTGNYIREKPEHMTHLSGNLLISKGSAAIAFRGKLDSLEARIVETQVTAYECGAGKLVEALDEVYAFVRTMMGDDVKNEPLFMDTLLGMDEKKLRSVSQNVVTHFGFPHQIPNYKMGRVCVALNSLRTAVRETEVAAVAAFCSGRECTRIDIVRALNRLSSCVYILFCQELRDRYKDEKNE